MNSITKKCSVEECERVSSGRGWCSMHYERWKRTGDPLKFTIKYYVSIAEKLIYNTRFPQNIDDCWIWAGKQARLGYGAFYWKGKYTSAHRAMYKQFVNPDIEGLDVDHLCRNTSCVN